MTTQLSVKLRPRKPSEVIGQPGAISYVRGMVKQGHAPNFILISGPSGTGKTTLARIIAALLSGWRGNPDDNPDMREVGANIDRGIDDVRALVDFSRFLPTNKRRRVLIVDEAHGYVGPAASALLKATEDPPKHVTWICCSSQHWKMHKDLIGRGQSLALKLLSEEDVENVLHNCIEAEELNLGKARDTLVKRMAAMSHGNARLAVQLLETVSTSMIGGATAREALELAVESNPAVEGFDAAIQYLKAVMDGSSVDAIKALGSGSGDGVLELVNMMMSGLVRRACGSNPKDGVGWAATKAIKTTGSDLPRLLDLQARLVAALDIRSRYFVPSDSLLFALARGLQGK